jgi:hypothetical protein
VADVVEATTDIRIKNVYILAVDRLVDGFDSIMTGASWSESVTVWLEFCLPFRFQTQFYQCLVCSVGDDGDTEGPSFRLSRFRSPYPSGRLRGYLSCQFLHEG